MSPEELKALEKRTKKLKRIASEWASKMHDLVEDRLPAAYEEIPEMARSTYAACEEWAKAIKELDAAQSSGASTSTPAAVGGEA